MIYQQNPNFFGGIIIAHDAIFYNNPISIEILPFDSEPGNIDDDNICEFWYCQFTKDQNLPCETTCPYDVSMVQTNGVQFLDCVFVNEFKNCESLATSIGINSKNATYRIERNQCLPPLPPGCEEGTSLFNGFYHAIYANNTIFRPQKIYIDGVTFLNNERAILMSSVSNSEIIKNKFEIPDWEDKTGYGLYLEGCNNYHVEGNTFTWFDDPENPDDEMTESSNYCSGIIVANNSNAATEIYRNIFENIEIGIRCQGNNSKLQLRCNEFKFNIVDYSIIVTSGVLGNQGVCNATITQPAGNQFLDTDLLEMDFRIIPNININYRHHLEPQYILDNYSTTKINLINCNVNGFEDCNSTLPGDIVGEERFSTNLLLTELGEAIIYESLKIDGGSTTSLINEIAYNLNPTELYILLDNISPYVSDSVLATVISEQALPTNEALEILLENFPIADTVANELEVSGYNIPESIIENLNSDIISDTLVVSHINELLATISVLRNKQELLLSNSTLMLFINNEIDSALNLLKAVPEIWSTFKTIEMHAAQNHFLETTELLNGVNTSLQEEQDFVTLYQTLVHILADDRLLTEINPIEEETIRSIANKHSSSGIAALNILSHAFQEQHPELIDPILSNEPRRSNFTQYSNNYDPILYPNPTRDYLWIEVMDHTETEKMVVTITDIVGNIISTSQKSPVGGIVWLDVSEFKPGIYICIIDYQNNIINYSKFIKQ